MLTWWDFVAKTDSKPTKCIDFLFSMSFLLTDTVLGKPPISPPLRTRSPERQSSPGLRRSVGRRLPDVPVSPTGEDLRQSTEVHIGRSNTMPRRKKEVSEFSKERILQELGIGMCSVNVSYSTFTAVSV